ncbi:MAG TPA: family 16 glycosylhydrolase [Verrucomicrobiae bacterium]|nr:family 16 glycosylhydrolase [Verrucomicrobiae bacterium]
MNSRPIIALVAIMFAAMGAFASPPNGYYLVWSDEFNGSSLDTSKWDYWLLGNRRDAVNTSSAVSVGGGNLTITTYTSGGTHYTAMIATDGTFRPRYGYWESSIKWSDTNGMWSAFWFQSPTMGNYLSDPIVSGSEIDDAEHRRVDGSNNNIANQVQVNIHWNGYGGSAESAGSGNVGSGLSSGFHTYGFLWTPGAYTFSIDGSSVYNGGSSPVSQSSEFAILSSEVDDTSTTWAGTIPSGGYGSLATSTTKLTADYVRYYAPTTMVFWTGANSTSLADSANYISNMSPVSVSTVMFSSLSGNNLSPSVNNDLSVNGLVFLWLNNGLGLNGANTLTIGAGGIDMLAANHTININCSINAGAAQTWSVGPNNPGNTLMVNGPVSGSATVTKSSWGNLILNGTNSFSGTLNIDTSATGTEGTPHYSDGITRVTRSENVANVPTIAIRNNNLAWSTLQLTNLLSNLTIPANVTLSGRNTNVPAIENLSGSNTLSGNLTINVGGGFYLLQSDGSGTLNFAGTVSSAAGGTRTVTLQGNGNFYVSGSIQNGSAATINLIKTNSGTLTIAGTSTFSGATTNYRGDVFINGSLAGSLTIIKGMLGGTGTVSGATLIQSGGTLSPGNSGTGALTFGNSLTLSSGCTNLFEINKSLYTNDVVRVTGSLALNGTLVVSNLAGNLTAGDSFKLFSAGNYTGNFSSVKLPLLDYGLAWNTNGLTNGILSVVATVSPQVGSVSFLGNGNFVVNGSSAAWQTNELDAATNLSPPINWLFVTSLTANVSGIVQLIDAHATNFPQRFYIIKTK